MNILFIMPQTRKKPYKGRYFQIISIFNKKNQLVFPILASLTPKKHSIKVIEENSENIKNTDEFDLVGITSITQQAIEAYKIADKIRNNGSKVVLGGWHPSALPNEAKEHADSVVIGEGEDSWPKLLKDFEKGNMKPFYKQTSPVNLESLPPIDTRIYPKGSKFQIIKPTRGCPNNCEFCAISNQPIRKKYRKTPIQDIIEDIKSRREKLFYFYDESLTVDVNYSKELFRKIKDLNIKFCALGNINLLGKDDELLKLANDAGCISWQIGFESISQTTLNAINKTSNKSKEYISSIKKIHDHGSAILGSFIFGFDTDTKDIFSKTNDFIAQADIDFPAAKILTPFPGTRLYERMEKEKRITTHDWSKYNLGNVVFKPKNMTEDELFFNVKDTYDNWYRAPLILNRLKTSLKSRYFGYWYFNNIFSFNLIRKFNITKRHLRTKLHKNT